MMLIVCATVCDVTFLCHRLVALSSLRLKGVDEKLYLACVMIIFLPYYEAPFHAGT